MLTTKNPRPHRVLLLGTFTAVMLGLVSGCAPTGSQSLRKGKQLVEEGKPAQAILPLRIATDLLPTNATAWNYLGLAYHGAGQFTNAQLAYTHALAHNSGLAEARFNLGCLYLENGRPELAKSEFTTFTLRRPQALEGWLKLGATQSRMRDLTGAEHSFSRALQLSSNNVEALNGTGVVQVQRGRARDAATSFQRALALQPDYAPALLNLAVIEQTQLNNPQQALQHYRAYLGLHLGAPNSDSVTAVVSLLEQQLAPKPATTNTQATPATNALARPALTHTPTTSSQAKTETPTAPASPATNGLSARPAPAPPALGAHVVPPVEVVHLSEQETVRSPRDRPQETPLAPTSTVGRNGGARTDSAPPSSTRAIAAAPATEEKRRGFLQRLNPATWFERGSRVESPPQSKQTNATLAAASPSRPPEVLPSAHSLVTTQAASTPAALNFKRYSYGSLSAPVPGHRAEALAKFSEGVAAQRAGDSNTAMAAYRSAIRADPTLFDAYYNLGVAAYDAGQMSVSLSAYESALVLRPDSRDTRYNFALAMRLADYPVDAAAELTKLLASNPNDAQVHFTLANLYGQQLGRPRLAREHFERVLAIEPNHPQAEAIRRWLAANPG